MAHLIGKCKCSIEKGQKTIDLVAYDYVVLYIMLFRSSGLLAKISLNFLLSG